jgi:hypothetical protein
MTLLYIQLIIDIFTIIICVIDIVIHVRSWVLNHYNHTNFV